MKILILTGLLLGSASSAVEQNPLLRRTQSDEASKLDANVELHPMFRKQGIKDVEGRGERKIQVSEADMSLQHHPMFKQQGIQELEGYELDGDDRERKLQDACTWRVITVKESEYDVDYKYGNIQYGATPIYSRDNQSKEIGWWYWEVG